MQIFSDQLNESETLFLKNSEKFKIFNKWCEDNGVISSDVNTF